MTDTNKRIDNLLENFDKGYVSYKEAKAEILQLIRDARIDERSKVDYELEVLQDIIDENPAFTDEFKQGVRNARAEISENTKDIVNELKES